MSHILPKKEWHVYKEVNKEKVKHDEQAEDIKNEKIDARALKASREARLAALRAKAGLDVDTMLGDGAKKEPEPEAEPVAQAHHVKPRKKTPAPNNKRPTDLFDDAPPKHFRAPRPSKKHVALTPLDELVDDNKDYYDPIGHGATEGLPSKPQPEKEIADLKQIERQDKSR